MSSLKKIDFNNLSQKYYWFDIIFLCVAAGLIFIFQSMAWPLSGGRDLGTYILYYNQIWDAQPEFYNVMLYRTPITPLFIGIFYKIGGVLLLEVLLGIFFIISIEATYYIGLLWSRPIGLVSAIVLTLFPTYGALFHYLGSDSLFAVGFITWMAFAGHTMRFPKVHHFIWHGIYVVLLILIRPGTQIFVFFAGFPFLIKQLKIGGKLLSSLYFLSVFFILLAGWASYNYVRYNDFTVSRTRAASIPFYRVFVQDRIVRPENGIATKELMRAIESDLKNREPYKSLGLDTYTILASGDWRVWSDLVGLSDRIWGWDSDYKMLQKVAMEAIIAYPWVYLKGVMYQLTNFFFATFEPPPSLILDKSAKPEKSPKEINKNKKIIFDGFHIIPRSYMHWLQTGPIRKNISDIKNKNINSNWKVNINLPVRNGDPLIAKTFNQYLSRLFPPIFFFILFGSIGIFLSAQARSFIIFFMLLSIIHALIVCMSGDAPVQYRIPFDPIYILIGVSGFIRKGKET